MSTFSNSYVSGVLFATPATGRVLDATARRWRRLTAPLFDAYRPELHNMRGPGPKEPLKKLPEAKRARGTPRRRGKRAMDELSETERIEKIQGGYLVRGANGEVLVHVYCRATESEALEENVLTEEEARQLAIDVAKLSALMRRD
jgi:hypothetical protein